MSILLVDKPKGITSHDVVDSLREITGERRIGHAGTLDPNATGLLIVGIGRESTKKLGNITKSTKKTYEAEIKLGEQTDTDDAEGVVTSRTKNFLQPCESDVKKILETFLGKKKQTPPAYSAIKIGGKKAYDLARKGKIPKLKARDVEIFSLELKMYEYPTLLISTQVSSGTYIRSLARDIGMALGCGGYLKNLRRTKIGKYNVEKSAKLDMLSYENWKDHVVEI